MAASGSGAAEEVGAGSSVVGAVGVSAGRRTGDHRGTTGRGRTEHPVSAGANVSAMAGERGSGGVSWDRSVATPSCSGAIRVPPQGAPD